MIMAIKPHTVHVKMYVLNGKETAKQEQRNIFELSNQQILTHISLALLWDIGKQCRPKSDAA